VARSFHTRWTKALIETLTPLEEGQVGDLPRLARLTLETKIAAARQVQGPAAQQGLGVAIERAPAALEGRRSQDAAAAAGTAAAAGGAAPGSQGGEENFGDLCWWVFHKAGQFPRSGRCR
jgi:hypothetical protein